MTEIVNSQHDMFMVATAPDPLVARELIKQHSPMVLTLDVEMPKNGWARLLGEINALKANASCDDFIINGSGI